MAGQDIVKSSKSSFMNGSPKSKQASILNFFGTKKEHQPSSSPLTKTVQNKPPIINDFDSTNEIEDVPPELFDEPLEFADEKPKKICITKKKINFSSKMCDDTAIIAPKILNDLHDAANTDFDQSDASAGRYQWLIDIKDMNGRKKGSFKNWNIEFYFIVLYLGEDGYDERTLYIPESAWSKFTPFEKQFWEIKTKFFDTVVFFKKGKFFELYENDADIGAKEFNLKMTDRVNMRMVGVPEATFDFWAAKFVGKGYKVAKVDQLENALSKTMREKTDKSKAEKIIRRELTSILTCGTLVDGNHLKTNNSNYCVSFKISEIPGKSEFIVGAAFVDASSAKFQMVDFEDDPSFVILSTLLAQISPKEIIIEKVFVVFMHQYIYYVDFPK